MDLSVWREYEDKVIEFQKKATHTKNQKEKKTEIKLQCKTNFFPMLLPEIFINPSLTPFFQKTTLLISTWSFFMPLFTLSSYLSPMLPLIADSIGIANMSDARILQTTTVTHFANWDRWHANQLAGEALSLNN